MKATQQPPHGTAARHRRGCTCWPCYDADRAYRNAFNRAGHPFTTDADQTRHHLDFLREHGYGLESVAKLAGISPNTVLYIRSGRQRRIRRSTADAILGITTDDRLDNQRVDKAEAVALIKRIVAAGVSHEEFAAKLGHRGGRLHITSREHRRITIRTLRKVQVVAQLMVRAGRVPASVMEVAS